MNFFDKRSLNAVIIFAACNQVFGYEAGDIIVRAGYAVVDPHDSSGDLSVNGSSLNGTGVGVDGSAALGITASYMLTSHWGIELLASSPFEHDITTKGLVGIGIANGTVLGSAKHLPPTISAQYYFSESKATIQPYVGVGINYTTFFSESVSSDAKSSLGAKNLNFDDSFGLAVEAGIDWKIDKNWLLSASLWRVQLDTDASMYTTLGRVKTDVTIDPWVYMVAIGYKF